MKTNVMNNHSSSAGSGLGSSAVDSNRFYSMLLDARTANVTAESTHDVSEKLLKGEKDNAKLALDHLWALKKAMTDGQADDTIERMISYYQEKINILREREDSIKKVGKSTRSLVEEKKKLDEELSLVKSKKQACAGELVELNAKIEALGKRELELTASEQRLRREIRANESRIVSGLCEIILRQPEEADDDNYADSFAGDNDSDAIARELAEFGIDTAAVHKRSLAGELAASGNDADFFERAAAEDVLNSDNEPAPPPLPAAPPPEPVVYPKSVVKMGGKVIGEYYHDGNVVSKDKRHYIYNSRFLSERLDVGMKRIKNRFSQEIQAELVKIAEDVANRIRGNGHFHFEVSTNEILNDKNLSQLIIDLKQKNWDDADRFGARLAAKISTLGSNYEAMLQEQMERCSEIN